MKKQKHYFKDIDSEMCYLLSYHIEEAKLDELAEIELIEAIPDNSNSEYIWCSAVDATGEKSECNKNCPDYEFVRGKGCKHKGKLFQHGELIKFNVETSQAVSQQSMKRFCPDCRKYTLQMVKLKDPNNIKSGEVWECSICKENTGWVE